MSPPYQSNRIVVIKLSISVFFFFFLVRADEVAKRKWKKAGREKVCGDVSTASKRGRKGGRKGGRNTDEVICVCFCVFVCVSVCFEERMEGASVAAPKKRKRDTIDMKRTKR